MYATLVGWMLAGLAAAPSTAVERPGDDLLEDLLTLRRTLTAHTRGARCLAFGPRGQLASGGQDGLLCLFNADGRLVRQVDLRPGGA